MIVLLAVTAYLAFGFAVDLTLARILPGDAQPPTVATFLWPLAVVMFVGGFVYGLIRALLGGGE